jgi:hypothetical protein
VAEMWGVGADARRPGRPVVACAALGVAAFALTFVGALVLGRGLGGSALAALLLPLALSGALAVGLAVAFVVAVALEQPYGARRVGRLVTVATPLAALVALFAYAGTPGGGGGVPLALGPADGALGVPRVPHRPPRVVSVPRVPRPPRVVPVPVPEAPAPPVAAPHVAAPPRVAGPVLPPPDAVPDRPVVAPRKPEAPHPADARPKRKVRGKPARADVLRPAATGGRKYASADAEPTERCGHGKAEHRKAKARRGHGGKHHRRH